jgi:hypothetical protein
VNHFKSEELIVRLADFTNEIQRRVAAVYNLLVNKFTAPMGDKGGDMPSCLYHEWSINSLNVPGDGGPTRRKGSRSAPLYSITLHIRGRLLSASCDTSCTIFAFALAGSGTNHLERRNLPVHSKVTVMDGADVLGNPFRQENRDRVGNNHTPQLSTTTPMMK